MNINTFNNNLNKIRTDIEELFENTKTQIKNQYDKGLAAWFELTHLAKKRGDYEDDFQDMSKVDTLHDVLYDNNGFVLSYNSEEVPLQDSYYTSKVHPITMRDSNLITGSYFASIFHDDNGFWGHVTETPTDISFSIDFKIKSDCNRVYLKTNNIIDITLYYKENISERDWIQLETKQGKDHIWNVYITAEVLMFKAKSNLICLNRLEVSKAKYLKYGYIISDEYNIPNLNSLTLETDTTIPENTDIKYSLILESGVFNIENNIELLTNVDWIETTDINLLSGWVDESLLVRSGYKQWNQVVTNDWEWVIEEVDLVSSSANEEFSVTFSTDYSVVKGGVNKVYEKNSDNVYEENKDYTIRYDDNTIYIRAVAFASGGKIQYDIVTLTCSIIIRKKIQVNQQRSYVMLDRDNEIEIDNITTIDTLRHLHIGNTIDHEEIVTYPTFPYSFDGFAGFNLVEVEGSGIYYTNPNLEFFSNRYPLRRVPEPSGSDISLLNDGEYFIYESGSLASGVIFTNEEDLWVQYAMPKEEQVGIQLKIELFGDGDNTPRIEQYKLTNAVETNKYGLTTQGV